MDSEEIKIKKRRMLSLDLAFESYEDDTGDHDNKLLNNIIKEINDLRDLRKKKTISETDDAKMVDDILKKYDSLLDLVGRNNFIFYDDGGVDYIWKYN